MGTRRRSRREMPPGIPQARSWEGFPCVQCGLPVEPAYDAIRPARCEDCFADAARRFSGVAQSVRLRLPPSDTISPEAEASPV